MGSGEHEARPVQGKPTSGPSATSGGARTSSVWVAAAVALAVRLLAAVAPGLAPAGLYEDAQIALNLAAGHGFALDAALGPTAMKAPAYPLLLAPVAALATTTGS